MAQTQSDPDCPVPLEVLGRLIRGGEEALDEALSGLSLRQRARLALFCNGRLHLRDLGLRIAAMCDEHDLFQAAGSAGSVLFQQARMERPRSVLQAAPMPPQRRISLPRLACLG